MAAMIRVVHLISSCMRNHGPGGAILAQIKNQNSSDFHSSVWSLYPPPPERDPRDDLSQLGAGYHVFSMGRSFGDIRILPPLVSKLRLERPDILHCHLVRANLYGRVAARLAGTPVVISTLRNVEDYFIGQDAVSHYVRRFERLTTGWVSKYVAVSEGVRSAAIHHLGLHPNQIITILNAVDLSQFQQVDDLPSEARMALGLRPDALVVGSLGNLEPRKNYAFLIRIAQTLCQQFENLQFVIVGEGEDRAMLEAMIVGLGLEDRVKMPGFHQDVAAVLKAFDVFVLPSLNEGLPRAVMEAMSVGLPCVVSDVGGNAEAVSYGENGYVVTSNDYAGFVSALMHLLSDFDLRDAMGRASRARAFAVFSPARMAKQYADLYHSLLSRSG